MSALIDIIVLPVSTACAWITVSHLIRMARRRKPWIIDGVGYRLTPLIFAGLCAAGLTVAGIVPLLPGVLAAALLLGSAVAVLGEAVWQGMRCGDGPLAARRILVALRRIARGGAEYIREDLRSLLGALRPHGAQQDAPRPVPVRATPGVPPWRRAVPGAPSYRDDPALGGFPAPAEVAAGLAAAGVMVPAAWAAVASDEADFEADNDEELCEHMDGRAAGILTWAESVMAHAEHLGDGAGLDPAYVAANYEFADDIAELAAHAAQVAKRYHDIYDDLREAADGKPLPKNRFFFGDGGAAPQDGRAA